ncbi:DMT family transporter [Fulvivirgaceae bacterium BMA10]|uniref:DMT family transporter n=1 Tax=Splendidivirga corallicola TaxID=3051826 RepID=A0ABT8KYF3_9BACT|nr:DMT family transporter [Fulvivirgaceae bacterium BMA10]
MTKKNAAVNPLISWALLIFLSIIWGSSFILIKKGLIVYSAGEVGALRILSASLVLAPFTIKMFRVLSKKDLWLLFISGVVGSMVPAFLFAIAQTQLQSSITGILNALTPFFVLIMGALFFHQKLVRSKVVGLAMGFIGTTILMLAGSEGSIGNINFFAFFVVGATICYGINVNLIKSFLHHLKPIEITSVSLLLSSPITIIYLFIFSDFVPKTLREEGALLALTFLLILGIVGTAFALIYFNKLIQLTNAVFASTVTYIIPIIAIAWGLIDGEILLIGHYIGIFIIIAGVYITNKRIH